MRRSGARSWYEIEDKVASFSGRKLCCFMSAMGHIVAVVVVVAAVAVLWLALVRHLIRLSCYKWAHKSFCSL